MPLSAFELANKITWTTDVCEYVIQWIKNNQVWPDNREYFHDVRQIVHKLTKNFGTKWRYNRSP